MNYLFFKCHRQNSLQFMIDNVLRRIVFKYHQKLKSTPPHSVGCLHLDGMSTVT